MSVPLIIEIFVPSGKTSVSSTSFFMFVPYFPEIPDIFINKVIFATKVASPRSNTKLSSRKDLKIAKPNRDYACTERRNYIDLTAVLKLLA